MTKKRMLLTILLILFSLSPLFSIEYDINAGYLYSFSNEKEYEYPEDYGGGFTANKLKDMGFQVGTNIYIDESFGMNLSIQYLFPRMHLKYKAYTLSKSLGFSKIDSKIFGFYVGPTYRLSFLDKGSLMTSLGFTMKNRDLTKLYDLSTDEPQFYSSQKYGIGGRFFLSYNFLKNMYFYAGINLDYYFALKKKIISKTGAVTEGWAYRFQSFEATPNIGIGFNT
ncbi:MAG: hypothetical protein MI717_04330 [Spirochaetales bacterium]|nr:hypothetical protein [Spirochaetales bacterium]